MEGVSDEFCQDVRSCGSCMTEEQMEALIERYGTHLLRLCTLYLKDAALAEDALQDTFVKAWEKYETFQGKASEKTWLTSIAVNVCKNYLRSPWNRRVNVSDLTQIIGQTEDEFSMADSHMDVMNAVLALKERYRVVILLYYYEELSVKEMAQMLSCKEATIMTRLKRARDYLAKAIKKEGGFEHECKK